jgi:hypothetical protein
MSTVLVCWCDVAFLVEALVHRGNPWVRGNLDPLVWLAALVLSAWSAWLGVPSAGPYHRADSLLMGICLDAIVFAFDGALIVHALKIRPIDPAASR